MSQILWPGPESIPKALLYRVSFLPALPFDHHESNELSRRWCSSETYELVVTIGSE